MGDFVRDGVFGASRNGELLAHLLVGSRLEERAGENDGARVFHAAETRRADDQREFFVRIRRNRFAEERQRPRGRREYFRGKRAIALWNGIEYIRRRAVR